MQYLPFSVTAHTVAGHQWVKTEKPSNSVIGLRKRLWAHHFCEGSCMMLKMSIRLPTEVKGFSLKEVITTVVTDYSLDLEYIMRTDTLLSERKRWGELISQNCVETVGQLTEGAQSNKSK